MAGRVSLQLRLELEGERADVALVRPAALVAQHVDPLVLLVGEVLLADLADEELAVDPVRLGVCVQVLLLEEGDVAHLALVVVRRARRRARRAHAAQVPLVVLALLVGVGEALRAVLAGEGPLGVVHRLDVLVQAAALAEALLAVGADLGDDVAVEAEVAGVALLLQSQSADRAVSHPR